MQYADLHESLNFHIAQVKKLVMENQTLKKEVKFLKASLKDVTTRNKDRKDNFFLLLAIE